MKEKKKNILESKGYRVGSVGEFLGLSTEESEYIELKLALSDALAKRRKKSNLTQAQSVKGRQNGKGRSDCIGGSPCKIIAGDGR